MVEDNIRQPNEDDVRLLARAYSENGRVLNKVSPRDRLSRGWGTVMGVQDAQGFALELLGQGYLRKITSGEKINPVDITEITPKEIGTIIDVYKLARKRYIAKDIQSKLERGEAITGPEARIEGETYELGRFLLSLGQEQLKASVDQVF